jgi:DNA-binding MarR family transcriptional regulator
MKEATLFTHPRRILLARALAHESHPRLGRLLASCDISLPALYRHLEKMERRGLISYIGKEVTLCQPKKVLTKTLLSIATGKVKT